MFSLLNIFSFLKSFQTPVTVVADSGELMELVTEDGNMMAFEDGTVWGVRTV